MRLPLAFLSFLLVNLGLLPLNAAPSWISALREGDKAYFLHALNPRIETFNLASQTWESPISLEKTPSAFHIDDSFLYIAYGKTLYRYQVDGTGESHFANLGGNVKSMKTDGDLLFVDYSSNSVSVDSFNRNTKAKLDSFTTTDYRWQQPMERQVSSSRLLAIDNYNRLVTLGYDSSGQLANSVTIDYFNFSANYMVYPWPNSSLLVGKSGYIYKNPQDKIAQLASDITALDFIGDTLPMIASGSQVIAYSRVYQETGSVTLAQAPEALFARLESETAFAFFPSDATDNGIDLELLSFESLAVDDPDAPIDPATLAFTPDNALLDQNGVLYLSHRSFEILFRWDSNTQSWLDNLPLDSSPNAIAFASGQNRLYLGYESGDITYFDTTSSTPTETLFKNVGHPVGLIVETGDFLFVDQYEGSSQTYHVYNNSGTSVDSTGHGRRDQFAVWNEATRRIIYTNKGSYNQVHSGGIDASGNLSDYTFSHSYLSGTQAPLYSHPSEGLVLTSNGYILKTDAQQSVTQLPEAIYGATWIDGRLYTVGVESIKSWDLPTYEENALHLDISQQAIGLFGTPDKHLILLSLAGSGQIRIKKLDTSYNVIAPDSLATPSLTLEKAVGSAARLSWTYTSGTASYELERSEDEGATWEPLTSVADAEITSYTDETLSLNSEYTYRVFAKNGDLESTYSNSVLVSTLVEPSDLPPLPLSEISGNLIFADCDDSGTLYLAFESTAAIFRYDLIEQRWLESIPLTKTPRTTHLSPSRNALLIGYSDGSITYLSLFPNSHKEIPFAQLENEVRFISSNSSYFVASDSYNQHILDNAGYALFSDHILYADTNEPFWWDNFSERFYWKDGYLYAAEIDENHHFKEIGNLSDSYYSGDLVAEDFTTSLLLMSDGSIFSVNTGNRLHTLDAYQVTGTWVSDTLFTATSTEIRKWNEVNYELEASKTLRHPIRKLLRGPNQSVVAIAYDYYSSTPPLIELLKTDLSVAPPETLATPSTPNLSNPQENVATITWNDVGGENGYIVERRTNGGEWQEIATLEANVTSYQDNDSNPDSTFEYRVKAVNGDLESAFSDPLQISQLAPTSPSNFTSRVTENNQIELSWDASENVYEYTVQRSTNAEYWSDIGNVSTIPLQIIDSYYFNVGELYYYRIAARGSYGRIAYSDVIVAGIDYQLPIAPTLYTQVLGRESINVYFNRTFSFTEKVRIERSLDSTPQEWTEIATFALPQRQFTDTGLTQNTRYLYRAISINPKGESAPSATASAITEKLYPPTAPSILLGQTEDESVQIVCSSESEEATLLIYRRDFLAEEAELIFESETERVFIDENVTRDQGYVYFAVAQNAAGSSPQSDPRLIVVKEAETLFSEDFESDIPNDRFTALDGVVVSLDGNKHLLPSQAYSANIAPAAMLSNGGTVAFSAKYANLGNYNDGTIYLSLYGENQNLYRFYRIRSADFADPDGWNRFYFYIPEELIHSEVTVYITIDGYYNDGDSPWSIDDIYVSQFPIQPPAKPIAVAAKATSEGDTAVFWIPSPDAKSYHVESSVDEGVTWTELAHVQSTTTFLHDIGYLENPVQYRVSAVNNAGASEPTYSEFVEGDYDLVLAIESGINKVLGSPDSYSLYTPEELEAARTSGQVEVKTHPDRFGLFREETISHLYYQLTNEWIPLKGGLISVSWSLYESTNLEDWTMHSTDFSFELAPESDSTFIRIAPNNESATATPSD